MGCATSSAATVGSLSENKNGTDDVIADSKITTDISATETKNGASRKVFRKQLDTLTSFESDPNMLEQTPVQVKRAVGGGDGDGLSNLSLSSKLTINDHVLNMVKSGASLHTDTHGHQHEIVDQSHAVLEQALKELSRSLNESNNNMYTIETSNTTDETGLHIENLRVQSPVSDTMTRFDNQFAVLDIGSGFCKAGSSGDQDPSFIMPTVVGKSKDGSFKESLIGNVAKLRKEEINLTAPVKRGVCVNWDEMENLYDHLINMELKMDLSEHGIAMVDTISNRKSREKLTEILFEKMNAGHFYLGNCGPLSCHALGQSSGLVVSMGHEVTTCFPVYNGNVIHGGVKSIEIGGSDVTNQLQESLLRRKQQGIEETDIVRSMMEKYCYVTNNYDDDLRRSNKTNELQRSYTLPSGKQVLLNKERFTSTDTLFKSHNGVSLPHMCVQSYEAALRQDTVTNAHNTMKNIILVGGVSQMNGVGERLQYEIQAMDNANYKDLKVLVLPKRKYAAWRGASLISSLTKNKSRWVTKHDYDEQGAGIIHRRYA